MAQKLKTTLEFGVSNHGIVIKTSVRVHPKTIK
jgi:hypothetical protein